MNRTSLGREMRAVAARRARRSAGGSAPDPGPQVDASVSLRDGQRSAPRGFSLPMSYQKIRKQSFPPQVSGTVLPPATKSIPKEMLFLVNKPLIQYGVEEAIAAGCTEIIIVTGRDKAAMEDHFDSSPELEAVWKPKASRRCWMWCVRSRSWRGSSTPARSHPLGLGHAVLMAREIIGDEPFCVLLPDDIVDARVPCMKQMVEAFAETQSSILASEVIEGPAISAYGCLDCTPVPSNPRLLEVKGMVEKPSTKRRHRRMRSSAVTF